MESDERVGAGEARKDRADWNQPLPSRLAGPTFWPAGMAFSVLLIAWGPAFFYTVGWLTLGSGLLLFIASLRGWLLELRDEMREAT